MEKTYWAFISYSSKDSRQGQWLHKRLENYPIPPEFRGTTLFDGGILGKNLRPVFRDRDELSGSADLGGAIGRALKASRFLIVLCSPHAAASEWVNKEIEEFKALGRERYILALILSGEPNATRKGRPGDECFPPALQYPAEPIAGDLRKEGDGKERGFLKVLAGITQLDFDKLYRRHERSQARRRTLLAAVGLSLVVLFASLAALAWDQSQRAEKSRAVAEEARNAAEEARVAAEKSEKKAKDAQTLAEDRLAQVEQQKKLTEEQRHEAVHQATVARSKFREVLFGKYQAAKSAGAQEEALAYLAEVLHLTREAKAPDKLLGSLLDFEQTQQMTVQGVWGSGLAKVSGAFELGGKVLLWEKNGGLWISREQMDSGKNARFDRLHPEWGNVAQVTRGPYGQLLVIAQDRISVLQDADTLKTVLDLGTTAAVRWCALDGQAQSLMVIDGSILFTYRFSDLVTGRKTPVQVPLHLPLGTQIFDFAFDPASRRLALRTNEAGIRRIELVDSRSGNIVSTHSRLGGWQPILSAQGHFAYCGSTANDTAQAVLINAANPADSHTVTIPWDNPSLAPRADGGLYLTSDQATMRTLTWDGHISGPLAARLDPFWGETELSVSSFGERIIVSSRHNLVVFGPERSQFPRVLGAHTEKIDRFEILKGGLVITQGPEGWKLQDLSANRVLAQGAQNGGLLSETGAETALVWQGNLAVLVDVRGHQTNIGLGTAVPLRWYAAKRLLAATQGTQLWVYPVEDSIGSGRKWLSSVPEILTEQDSLLLAITRNEAKNSLEFLPWDPGAQELKPVGRLPAVIKGNAIPVTPGMGPTLYWIDSDGAVVQLVGDHEVVRYTVDSAYKTLLPVDAHRFALVNSQRRIELFQDGRPIRSFVASSPFTPVRIVALDDQTFYVLASDGSLGRYLLPMEQGQGGLVDDGYRVVSPDWEAHREGPEIVVTWTDGTVTRLEAPGMGVPGYWNLVSNPRRTWLAAFDKDRKEILAWSLDHDKANPPVLFPNDDSYGGLWFASDDVLVASILGKALVYHVGPEGIRALTTISLPGMGRANMFLSHDGQWFFGVRGQKRLLAVAARGGPAHEVFGNTEVWGLGSSTRGLILGLEGASDLVDWKTSQVIRHFKVPESVADSWQVWRPFADPYRGWLILDHSPGAVLFDLASGGFIGALKLPESPVVLELGRDTPDRLYVAGNHFVKTFDFRPSIRDLDAWRGALPFIVNGTEVVERGEAMKLEKEE